MSMFAKLAVAATALAARRAPGLLARWAPGSVVTATTNVTNRDRQPRLEDLHPDLRVRVESVAREHQAEHPDRALCLIWAHRTPAEQAAEFAKGFTGINGRTLWGLHNYLPSLAADLWVYEDGRRDHVLTEGRPPKEDGATLRLLGKVWPFYQAMGAIARRYGLEWGGDWQGLRDGPHVQLSRPDRLRALQSALAARGFSPGPVDGEWGPKTARALESAGARAGLPWAVSARQARTMPCPPALWAWLHDMTTERSA